MVERDYLLRQLQVFAQGLAEALGMRDQGKILESLYMLDDLIRSDQEARNIADLPLDEFIDEVDFMQDFNTGKWAMIAEALFEKGKLLHLQGNLEAGKNFQLKAMHLVLEVLLSDPETYRESSVDLLAELKDTFSGQPLPARTILLLQEYACSLN